MELEGWSEREHGRSLVVSRCLDENWMQKIRFVIFVRTSSWRCKWAGRFRESRTQRKRVVSVREEGMRRLRERERGSGERETE
eukprot:6184382-Pleurochrysis_carterae.AAC.1